MVAKKRRTLSSVLLVVFSLAFVACCGFVLCGVVSGTFSQDGPAGGESTSASIATWPDCSWDDVSKMADEIEIAPDYDSARSLAASYGLLDADGKLTSQPKQLILSNNVAVPVRLVGICADDLADGSRKAGLTFFAGPIAQKAMNDSGTNVGGWEGSSLRAWLASEGQALFPEDLSSRLKPVLKTTNNVGATEDPVSALSQTSDTLWVPSCSEVFGELTWFAQEYGDSPIWNTAYTDFKPFDESISNEGAQYELFSEAGIADKQDPDDFMASFLGVSTGNWWTRTPYPVSFIEGDDELYYQVKGSGYPSTLNSAAQENCLIVGFCL